MLYREAMQRTNQLCLTSDMVLMLLLLFGTNSCHGLSNNNAHIPKKLLKEAVEEYKTITDYLAKLLHLLESHRLAAISNTSTNTSSLHYSTVKRIPYPMNIHPLLPYQQPALKTDASFPAPPLYPTTPTPSKPALDLTIATPALSYNSTVAPRLISSSISEVHMRSSTFSVTPTVHMTLSTTTYSPTVPPIVPTSTVPPSSVASMSYDVSSHPIISRTSLPSLNASVIHPRPYSSSNATTETHSSPMYPSLHHPSDISHSFKDSMNKDTEDEYFGNVPTDRDDTKESRIEAFSIQSKVPDGGGINTDEHRNTSLINTSGDGEGRVENDTKVMPSNGDSGASERKGSLPYEEEMLNSRRQWELGERREMMTESPFEETAETIMDEIENQKNKEITESFVDKIENQRDNETAESFVDETENQKVREAAKNIMDETEHQKDRETATNVMDETENQEDKETTENIMDEIANQEDTERAKNITDETENQKDKVTDETIVDETGNQKDKETEREREDNKENENIEHTRHDTISTAESDENLTNDNAKQEEKQTSETSKSNNTEEEEQNGDTDTTKKMFKTTRLKLNNTKDAGKKTRKNENLLNSEDDNTRQISEAESNEEEDEKRENEPDEGADTDVDKQSHQYTDNSYMRSMRINNDQDALNHRIGGETEKQGIITHKREFKEEMDVALKERDDEEGTKDTKWLEDEESSEKLTKPEEYEMKDTENEKQKRDMNRKLDPTMKEAYDEKVKDKKWVDWVPNDKEGIEKPAKPEEYEMKDTENEKYEREMKQKPDAAMKERDKEARTQDTKWVEGKDRSQESTNPDEYETKGKIDDRGWTEMKTQEQKEKISVETEDEAEPESKMKKRKRIHDHHQESEQNEDSLQVKNIKEIQKHDGTANQDFPYPQKTQYEDKNRDYETVSPQGDIPNTNTSGIENKESDSNRTTKTAKNKKSTGGLMDDAKPPYNVPKQRKRRHIVHVPPTTTPKPSPHLCTKDTPENKHHLCDQLFSALEGVEEATEELVREGVTRKGVDHLQEKVWVLGKVVRKIEGDASFFLTMDHQLIVSYIHRLDQTVTKAKRKLEARLAKHRGPSLMLLVALGVGGGLVVLILLVTAALVVARRRQVRREEFYRKQICGEQIPIQSFLNSGHSNLGMTEDEPHPHLQSVLGSRYCQDLAAGGCHGFTQEGSRRSKECSTMTTSFDSTPATKASPNSTGNPNHTVSKHPIQSGSAQNHDG